MTENREMNLKMEWTCYDCNWCNAQEYKTCEICGKRNPWDMESDLEKEQVQTEMFKKIVQLMVRNYERTGKPYFIKNGEKILDVNTIDGKEDWPPNILQTLVGKG